MTWKCHDVVTSKWIESINQNHQSTRFSVARRTRAVLQHCPYSCSCTYECTWTCICCYRSSSMHCGCFSIRCVLRRSKLCQCWLVDGILSDTQSQNEQTDELRVMACTSTSTIHVDAHGQWTCTSYNITRLLYMYSILLCAYNLLVQCALALCLLFL